MFGHLEALDSVSDWEFGDPDAWRIAGLVVQRLSATKLSGHEARRNFELVKTLCDFVGFG